MIRFLLKSKIHRATVTEAHVDYVGSITIDRDLLERADIVSGEKVLVVDVDNGARLETYAIAGKPGSGGVCMNGAAAHLVRPGERIIIMSFAGFDPEEARRHAPRVVFVDEENRPTGSGHDPGEVAPAAPHGALP